MSSDDCGTALAYWTAALQFPIQNKRKRSQGAKTTTITLSSCSPDLHGSRRSLPSRRNTRGSPRWDGLVGAAARLRKLRGNGDQPLNCLQRSGRRVHGIFQTDAILFWCYQLDQSFGFNVTYNDYTAKTISDPANAALSELFTEVGGPANVITSDLLSVAFQLAVWEIKYDSGGPFDLFNGNFQVTSGANATTAQAQTWLNNLGSIQGYTITLLHSDSAQDFVMGVPKPPKQELPEPSALLLLGLGLATMFAVTRRRGSLAQGML